MNMPFTTIPSKELNRLIIKNGGIELGTTKVTVVAMSDGVDTIHVFKCDGQVGMSLEDVLEKVHKEHLMSIAEEVLGTATRMAKEIGKIAGNQTAIGLGWLARRFQEVSEFANEASKKISKT